MGCIFDSTWRMRYWFIHYLFHCMSVAQSKRIENIENGANHYTDVIMTTMTSQITILTVVYSAVYSDADQRKHQIYASLAFVWGIHRDRWIPRTKGQLRGKCFHLMTSSCGCSLQWWLILGSLENTSTLWVWDEMADISLTTISNSFLGWKYMNFD